MPCSLPEPLSEYFAAANARDPDRVAACFAESAIVRDEGREIRGRSNIRAWAEHTGRIYRYTATVMAAEQTADRAVVTAHLTGDFPGNPIDSALPVHARAGTHCSIGDRAMRPGGNQEVRFVTPRKSCCSAPGFPLSAPP
jgi:hypothetical protein